MSISTRLLFEAAERRGLDLTRMPNSKSTYIIRIKDKEYIWTETGFGNPSALFLICKNKLLAHTILEHYGYNVPSKKMFSLDEKAAFLEYMRTHSNVVVKPLDGSHGDDITVLPEGDTEFEEAWALAINGKKSRKEVLVEEYVPGEDYRLLVVGNKCIFVVHRIPATVYGNGTMTIRELIELENKNPERGAVRYGGSYSPIEINKLVEVTLRHNNMTLDTVPTDREKVVLTGVCNLGCGGTVAYVTSEVHPQVMQDAVGLGQRLGMDIVAIDVRCEDISAARSLNDMKILELNATPGITPGSAEWTVEAVWDAILEKYEKM